MKFKILEERLAVCRLAPHEAVPTAALDKPFSTITRTADELSIVLHEKDALPSWEKEAGWRALEVEGPLDFGMVGVIAQISALLAAENIPIFVISTFDTDYILVKEELLDAAVRGLQEAGHSVF